MSDEFEYDFGDGYVEDDDETRLNSLESLAQAISGAPPKDDDGEDMEAILVKWILVTEWADAHGNVWLTRRWATGSGSSLATWDMKGMLHEALYGDRW